MDVMESELALKLAEARMMSQCAIMSHPDTDYDKVVSSVKQLYAGMLSTIDYITGGEDSEDVEQSDRMAAVERYRKHRAETLKKYHEDKKKEELKIEAVN